MKRVIEITIDELVLDGVGKMDSAGISEAVEAKLAQIIEEKGFPGPWASTANLKHLDGGSLSITRAARPENIGAAIAGSVYQGITTQKGSSNR